MIIPGGLLAVRESVTRFSLDNLIISEKSTLRGIEPKARSWKIQLRHWAVSKGSFTSPPYYSTIIINLHAAAVATVWKYLNNRYKYRFPLPQISLDGNI